MDNDETLTREAFASLLGWLGSDELAAARKYENIRRGLIRFFAGRGCPEADRLADLTIDRVAGKLNELIKDYEGDPALYFYGVAKHVLREWRREPKAFGGLGESRSHVPSAADDRRILEKSCLRDCLNALSERDRNLVTDYYRGDKREKIDWRKMMAKKLGISPAALQTKVYRLRSRLSKCVIKCAGEKK